MRRKNTRSLKVGCTVIAYILGDKDTKEWVKVIKVRNKIDSDHLPVQITINGREREKEKQGGREQFWREMWDRKGKEQFSDELGNVARCGDEIETGRREMEENI